MRRTPLSLGIALALATALVPSSAGAAGTVGITSAVPDGDTLTVTGTSTYTAQPFVILGTDGTADNVGGAPVAAAGADVVAASMATQANGGVQIRWTVDQLPPVTNGTPTGIHYGWAFCVQNAGCHAVTSQRVIGFPPQPNGGHDLWNCADEACAPGAWTYVSTGAAVYDGTAKTITVSLTASQIGASPGAKVTHVPVSDQGAAYSGFGESLVVALVSPGIDGVLEMDEFTIARREVSLAVGPSGLDPAEVAYPTTVSPAPGGAFSATLDVAGLSGERVVYAKACFGDNNCAYATQDVTL